MERKRGGGEKREIEEREGRVRKRVRKKGRKRARERERERER